MLYKLPHQATMCHIHTLLRTIIPYQFTLLHIFKGFILFSAVLKYYYHL